MAGEKKERFLFDSILPLKVLDIHMVYYENIRKKMYFSVKMFHIFHVNICTAALSI